jgi:hypothetical protein
VCLFVASQIVCLFVFVFVCCVTDRGLYVFVFVCVCVFWDSLGILCVCLLCEGW